MKGLGSIHFLSTALMAIAISFVGYAATESAQAQPAANITTTSTQKYSAQDDAKRELVLKFYRAFNTGNTALIDEAFADNWVDYPTPAGISPGKEGAKQIVRSYRATFSGFYADVKNVVIQGDWVVVRAIGSGTHSGRYLGIPATGKRVRFQAFDLHRISNDRIVETWNVQSLLSVVYQLGWKIAPASSY